MANLLNELQGSLYYNILLLIFVYQFISLKTYKYYIKKGEMCQNDYENYR